MPLKDAVSQITRTSAVAFVTLALIPAGAAAAARAPKRVNALITGTVHGLTSGHPTITFDLRSRTIRMTKLGIFLPGGLYFTGSVTRTIAVSGTHMVGRLGPYLLIPLPSGTRRVTIALPSPALREGAALRRGALRNQRQEGRRYLMHLRFRITVHTTDNKRTLRPLISGT